MKKIQSITVGGPNGEIFNISSVVEVPEKEPKPDFIRGEDLHDCTPYSEQELCTIREANSSPGRD
jgi:hypothetical protein